MNVLFRNVAIRKTETFIRFSYRNDFSAKPQKTYSLTEAVELEFCRPLVILSVCVICEVVRMDEEIDLELSSENADIANNLKLGIFSTVSAKTVNKKIKSKIFENDHFKWIRDENEKVLEQKIVCSVCQKVYNFDSHVGTKNHLWHMERCLRRNKTITAANIDESDHIQIRDNILDDVVRFVTQDLRPFSSVIGPGFLNLANKFIQVGTLNGNVKAEIIIPHPTTVSRRLPYVAAQKRQELKEHFKAISKQGIAISTDIWTDDYQMKSFLGVNAHFVHKGSLNERTLCVRATEDKTAINIRNMLEEILAENDIAMENAVFVTDRGGKQCLTQFHFLPSFISNSNNF